MVSGLRRLAGETGDLPAADANNDQTVRLTWIIPLAGLVSSGGRESRHFAGSGKKLRGERYADWIPKIRKAME